MCVCVCWGGGGGGGGGGNEMVNASHRNATLSASNDIVKNCPECIKGICTYPLEGIFEKRNILRLTFWLLKHILQGLRASTLVGANWLKLLDALT